MFIKNKKGAIFSLLESLIFGFLFIAIMGVVALTILSSFRATIPATQLVALGAIDNATFGISQMFQQFGTVGLLAGLAIVIGILMYVFGRQMGSGSPI